MTDNDKNTPDTKQPLAEPHSGSAATRLTARDFHPEVLRLFDRYVHGLTDRRGFLEGAAKFATAAGLTAAGLLDALNPRFAQAQQVPPQDPRLDAEYVDADSPDGYGKLRGYLVRPKRAFGRLPAVLVVHENRGLNPHIEDVARRIALERFMVFAPDALFPLGGYPGDEDKARELFGQLDQAKTQEDFVAAAHYLARHPRTNSKLGVVGFCYGGGMVNLLATRLPSLDAAVPFYGMAPELDAVPRIKAELQLHFAENDERINASWPAYESALQAAEVTYEAFSYPGTQHGFNNDTTPRYDAEAANLAWGRMLELFDRTLCGAGQHALPGHHRRR
jgi:carboxymethylenebutenolidase